jgi:hypothetical protein
MRDIDRSALEFYNSAWAHNSTRSVDWPWPEIYEHYRRNYPERFEAALWSGNTLCGLAIGRLNNARDTVTLYFMEGCPDVTHPLKGTVHKAVLEAIFAFGVAAQATRIRINDPMPGAIPLYEGLGFSLVEPLGKSAYCERGI